MGEHREVLKAAAPMMVTTAVLVLLWVAILCGVGSRMEWPDVAPSSPVPAAASLPAGESAPPPPLQHYVSVWTEPLFTPGRTPDKLNIVPVLTKPVPPLAGYALTGIIITQQIKVALLKASSGEAIAAKEGQILPNGWRLDRISDRQIELVFGQHRNTLEISTPRLPMTFP